MACQTLLWCPLLHCYSAHFPQGYKRSREERIPWDSSPNFHEKSRRKRSVSIGRKAVLVPENNCDSFCNFFFFSLFSSSSLPHFVSIRSRQCRKEKKERNKGREESFSASFLLQSDASETHKLLFCCWLLALHHFQLYRLGKGRRDCIAAALVLSVVSSI